MNTPHTDEVIACMINIAKDKKEIYINEYKYYLKSIEKKKKDHTKKQFKN